MEIDKIVRIKYFRWNAKINAQIWCICQEKNIVLCTETFESAIFFVFCTRFRETRIDFASGEMLEWLKRHAWKACKPLKGFAGSNPALSAF